MFKKSNFKKSNVIRQSQNNILGILKIRKHQDQKKLKGKQVNKLT